ncbi:hypothetical protein FHETE_4839 [Fusarium heterosporum]|uniref:Uncharacterized protein n=1 Tax=Fusarium heterosporum TaxID=42747 RepID=A0A8H5TIA3_FUSHE|nr:hypothetical protein FHETE_4839 [Fusarium heterosporum]
MSSSDHQSPFSKSVFPPSYGEANKCIGYAKTADRRCDKTIGVAKIREHNECMRQLGELPSEQRVHHPLLQHATQILLCCVHLDQENFIRQFSRAQMVLRGVARDGRI